MAIKGTKTWDDVQVWKFSSGATQAGSYDTASAWTLGTTGVAQTTIHQFNGSIGIISGNAGGVPNYIGSSGNGSTVINYNGKPTGTGVTYTRQVTDVVVGMSIGSLIIGGSVAEWHAVASNTAGTSATYSSTTVKGACGSDGTWTFGSTAGAGQNHTFRSAGITSLQVNSAATTNNSYVQFNQAGSVQGYVGCNGSSGPLVTGSSTGDMFIVAASRQILFSVDNGSTIKGKMDTSGHVTFSGSMGLAGGPVNPGTGLSITRTTFFCDFTSTQSSATMFRFETTSGPAGSITSSTTTTAYNTSSDERLKHDIVDLEDAWDIIDQIQPREFKWNGDDTTAHGFIAQELHAVYPSPVTPGDETTTWMMDPGKLVPLLMAGLKELKAEFDAYVTAHP